MAWNRSFPEGLSFDEQAAYPRRGGDANVCSPRTSWHRRELSVAVSDDDGGTWSDPVVMIKSDRNGSSYPTILEREPGLLWLTTRFKDRGAIQFDERILC